MRKITQTIVGTTPPLDKNVVWLDSTDSTAPVEKVFINGQWTPMGVDTDDYYTKDDVDRELAKKLNVIKNPVQDNLIAMNSQGQAIDSGKKVVNFIANPEVTGQYADVLTLNSNKEPVWTPLTPGGDTIDTEMIDGSEHAVQNGVIKKYVDDNCARKDGYYSTLTVGSAENLVGQTVDKDAYLIRPTATSDEVTNEVANGVASVLGMEGNSCVWNQLLSDSNFSRTPTGTVSYDASTDTITISDTISNIGYGYTCKLFDTIINHKYYISIFYNLSNATYFWAKPDSESATPTNLPYTGEGKYSFLQQATTNGTKALIGYSAPAGTTVSGTVTKVNIIDLTLLGIDNLTTVAQVEAWLAQHVGTKPYYAYNAGTILSAQTLGIKTYGQNLLNPTTRQAKLIPYEWIDGSTNNSNKYTVKNIPSGATVKFTPDATGVEESVTITDNKFDITSYGSGILELSSATADTYVCMKWNEQKDDDVVPYEEHTQGFDVRKVYGKVNGEGSYVQCYPNGMRSVDIYKDTLTASEVVVKIGKGVFNGTENWTSYQVSAGVIAFGISNGFGYQSIGISNLYVLDNDSYTVGTFNLRWKHIKYMNFYEDFTKYPDVTSWKNHLASLYSNGTPLTVLYVLSSAEQKTYTDLIYRDGGIDRPLADVLMNIEVNNWSMEEQLMTPYDANGNPTAVPAKISTQYGMDAVEQIDTLNKTCYFAQDVKDNLQALLTCINTNCSETLGGTFSIGDPTQEDSKVFTFTFAPNVEPTNEGE